MRQEKKVRGNKKLGQHTGGFNLGEWVVILGDFEMTFEKEQETNPRLCP